MRYILIVFILFLVSCGNTIYVVRHAEKQPVRAGASQQEASDPPLSAAGKERATELVGQLRNKNVSAIYTTNFKRTISTAQPLADLIDVEIQVYNSRKDSMDAFIDRLRGIKKGSILVVGHSNTIDDIANKLAGTTVVAGDLDESQYDNLYILKRKGKTYSFTGKKYGAKSQ